jgi:dTDP-4-amino-4,6-dideoxygalactose transaminase
MDIQAAMGIHQLPRIHTYWKRRKEIWDTYNQAFKNLPVFLPASIPDTIKHSYHLYTLLLDIDRLDITRDRFLEEMTKRNIGVGVHYIALHLQPYYQQVYDYKPGQFPNSQWISQRTVSLPLSPKLSDTDVQDVINAVHDILD